MLRLNQVYHLPVPVPVSFPYRFSTPYIPSSPDPIGCLARQFFINQTDTFKMTEAFCKLVPAIQQENIKVIDQLCTEELATELKAASAKLRAEGYRMTLVNPWAVALEYKIFESITYSGLSPLKEQNFQEEDYNITQSRTIFANAQVKCKLKVPIPPADADPTPQVQADPYSIRHLKRTDPSLYTWLDKFPLEVKHVDIAILSKLRLRLTDLYSQSKVVAGGDDDDEFEFHLLRFQKVAAKDPQMYQTDSSFQRFVDSNFKNEFFSWRVADFDNCLKWSLFSNYAPTA